MHSPVNHPLRPVYRALSVLAGAYLVIFGILGLFATGSAGLFAVGDTDPVLGQGTNLAWSIASIGAGAVVAACALMGRNLDVVADRYVGWALLVIATAMLALIRTEANILNFSIFTVVVTYVVGLVLITAGLYSKVVAPRDAGEPRQERQAETV